MIGDWTSDFYLQTLYVDSEAKDNNDASIVIKTGYKGVDFLLIADASSNIEENLLDKFDDISADVLKEGHNGSNISSSAEFVNAVGSKIYKTASDCNITVTTNGVTHAVSNSCKKAKTKPIDKPIEKPIEKPIINHTNTYT